ncbi:antibiotic biosynthesis monooxygenase family protein [Streptomyces sp. NPDC091287]|uniref:antibiotic biosynthesis monooxygenase family protein n=1 Tax=Streptomyces sp. NPDC091287 TaxID=3365988 RepID=UPI003827B354
MIRLGELDPATPFPAQLQSTGDDGPVTLFNTITAPEGHVPEVIQAWTADAAFMKAAPGFVRAQLYQGTAGSNVLVNIAVWETVEQLREAFSSPEFQTNLAHYPDGTVATPHLFHKRAVAGICVG